MIDTSHDTERVVSALIDDAGDIASPPPAVTVTTETGAVVKLFRYYPDELHFSPEEFLGRTVADARNLKGEKDRQYLRS